MSILPLYGEKRITKRDPHKKFIMLHVLHPTEKNQFYFLSLVFLSFFLLLLLLIVSISISLNHQPPPPLEKQKMERSKLKIPKVCDGSHCIHWMGMVTVHIYVKMWRTNGYMNLVFGVRKVNWEAMKNGRKFQNLFIRKSGWSYFIHSLEQADCSQAQNTW